MVRQEGDGDFHIDSLDFGRVRGENNDIIASGIGLMANDAPVELILWARGDTVTYLELEPSARLILPARPSRRRCLTWYTQDHMSAGRRHAKRRPMPSTDRTRQNQRKH